MITTPHIPTLNSIQIRLTTIHHKSVSLVLSLKPTNTINLPILLTLGWDDCILAFEEVCACDKVLSLPVLSGIIDMIVNWFSDDVLFRVMSELGLGGCSNLDFTGGFLVGLTNFHKSWVFII